VQQKIISAMLVWLLTGIVIMKADALEKVTYADSGVVPLYSVVWVGAEAGIFKKNGLDLTVITATSTAQVIQSLLSGNTEMGNADTVGALVANQKGAELVTIMNYQKTILFDFFVRNEIRTFQDLKGKKIGIARFGGTADHMSRLILRKMGLNPDTDVTFLQIGSGAERTAALINNSVQGILVSPPEPVKLAKEPSLRRLSSLSELGVVYPYFSFITSRKYLKDHRDVFRYFVKGYLESLKFYATNMQSSIDIISKRLRIKDNEILENIYKSTIENSYMKPYVPKDVDLIYEFAQRDTKKPITVKWQDTYDNSFVKELDESGFIDKLFEGVTNAIRETVVHN
jgi:ABC-type nitrate/sulfonate/bicarbonate transport system substrate-binding protein